MTEKPTNFAAALKPCPFCGETRISFNPPDREFKGSINCLGCMASMPREVNDDQELIDCWNARTTPPEPTATVKHD